MDKTEPPEATDDLAVLQAYREMRRPRSRKELEQSVREWTVEIQNHAHELRELIGQSYFPADAIAAKISCLRSCMRMLENSLKELGHP